jgi:hypothetical protein
VAKALHDIPARALYADHLGVLWLHQMRLRTYHALHLSWLALMAAQLFGYLGSSRALALLGCLPAVQTAVILGGGCAALMTFGRAMEWRLQRLYAEGSGKCAGKLRQAGVGADGPYSLYLKLA